MKKYLTLKRIGTTLLVLLILAQFKTIDKTSRDNSPENDFIEIEEFPKEVAELLKTACYDCHSNTTNYPWYSNIAPISWWIKKHVRRGTYKLNYSEWGSYDDGKRKQKKEESADYIRKGWMPIGTYKLAHPEARLTDEQRELLVNWLNPTD